MRKHLITIALLSVAAMSLVACNRNSTPPEKSSGAAITAQTSTPAVGDAMPATPDSMTAELGTIAGKGAADCGRVPASHDPAAASECATKNFEAKKPFYVRYDLPLPNGQMAIATILTADGKLMTAQYDSTGWEKAPEGGKLTADKKVSVQPCPAPNTLRTANSGRVTCFPPAQMPAGMSPHGGGGSMTMPPATGANPHGGGMGMPAPGTPNPHKTDTSKSH
jgi:hypothetical protein